MFVSSHFITELATFAHDLVVVGNGRLITAEPDSVRRIGTPILASVRVMASSSPRLICAPMRQTMAPPLTMISGSRV